MENVNTLEHTGVMGMHWGHKKSSGWSAKDNTVAKQHVTKSGGKIAKPYVKPATTKITSTGPRLTDAQLKSRINRLEMEKKYATLTKKEMSPGMKFVKDMLLNTAKTAVTTYSTKYINKTLEGLLKAKIPTDTPTPTPTPPPAQHSNTSTSSQHSNTRSNNTRNNARTRTTNYTSYHAPSATTRNWMASRLALPVPSSTSSNRVLLPWQ